RGGIRVEGGIVRAVDAAFSGLVPAGDPVRNVEAAVDAEFGISAEDFPPELGAIDHFEAGALRFDCERMDAAARTAAEIAEEEVFVVFFGQTGSRIVGKTGRTVGDEG